MMTHEFVTAFRDAFSKAQRDGADHDICVEQGLSAAIAVETKRCVRAAVSAWWPHYAATGAIVKAVENIDPGSREEVAALLKSAMDQLSEHMSANPPRVIILDEPSSSS